MKKIFILFFVVLSLKTFSYETWESCENCYKNWFKGGPLSFSGLCLKKDTFKLKNYCIVENTSNFYDNTWLPQNISHRIGFTEVFDLRLGFLPHTDLTVIFKEQSQFLDNNASARFGDTALRLGVELYHSKQPLNVFNYRFILQQTFPTGHFKNLNPSKKDVEVSGLGYYRTGAILAAEILKNIDKRLLRTRLNLSYGYSTRSCLLTNYNLYGGGQKTKGYLGAVHDCFAILGLEYTLTQNVCIVSDFQYSFSSKASFKGKKGVSSYSTEAFTERPIFQSITMAPGLQINFSYNWGLNLCCWFSAAGKNTPSFQSAIIELVVRN